MKNKKWFLISSTITPIAFPLISSSCYLTDIDEAKFHKWTDKEISNFKGNLKHIKDGSIKISFRNEVSKSYINMKILKDLDESNNNPKEFENVFSKNFRISLVYNMKHLDHVHNETTSDIIKSFKDVGAFIIKFNNLDNSNKLFKKDQENVLIFNVELASELIDFKDNDVREPMCFYRGLLKIKLY
ncbi:hypothetical protein [Mycoplasma sp. Mirounga ES2805-ORL]|uniref:hypothetical protein n=1 Tax=Mycoplasma sp. Mirounga ES2805-ORL TaxID=754514 RepID=UPI00197C1238|nr:hypothetical protein [Mycoplasma sp. Mirounga ES2805-ORL]QSF13764.1 hypothetical protein JXZ90_00475 [Mycoplasma sp. Mirounga ES2805-ORL]